ncbi:MAG TPA: Crp/Fnr family transcriptional regulator [Pyrinomonadaceae bacterium]|nr:Crp/Fnr family transcriptional regulator [Pyrinomonadaceae bacterium]
MKPREVFKDVEDDALKAILKVSTICELRAGQALHPTIDQVSYVYIILSGYLAIWGKSEFTGREENFLAWRGPGQIIGEMRSVGAGPTATKIVACEICTFVEIRNDTFTDIADGPNKIYRNIGLLLIQKMAHDICRSEIIRMSPAPRQVAQALLHLAHERIGDEKIEDLNRIEIPGVIRQREISSYIGISREVVNVILSDLKEKHVIDYRSGSRITILDRAALKEMARNAGPHRKRKNEDQFLVAGPTAAG